MPTAESAPTAHMDHRSILHEMDSGYALHEVITDQHGIVVDYRFLDVNPAFEKLTGLVREQIIGQPARKLLPETEDVWIERYGKVALTGQSDSFESYAVEFDKHFQVNAFCPQAGQFAVIFNDITAHKKNQEKLTQQYRLAEKAEAELMAIYQNSPIMMFVVNGERRMVKLNRATLEMIQLSEEEAIGKKSGELFRCIHAASGDCGSGIECNSCMVRNDVLDTLKSNSEILRKPVTLTQITEQGAVKRYLLLSSTPLPYETSPRALVCLVDLTANFKEQQLRQESEQRYQRLFKQFEGLLNAIADPIGLLNADFDLIWSNQTYGFLQGDLGCSEKGLVFQPFFIDENSYPVRRCIKTAEMAEGEVDTPDGRTWQLRAFPLPDEEGQVQQVIFVAIDISEKKRIQEDAMRSSRMASLGVLATGLAHEINNPNALVLYNSDILLNILQELIPHISENLPDITDVEFNGLSWADVEQEIPGLLTAMSGGAKRIKRIVDDLRDFARHEKVENLESTDINQVASSAARLVQNSIKKSTDHFSLDLAAELPALNADAGRLEQVIINLLLNACQALDGPAQAVRLKTSYHPESARIVLQVFDEGAGIAQEVLNTITEPFMTTKRDAGGTGLGLSVSERIAKEHGGRLCFESQQHGGTCVSLVLPVDSTGG